MGCYLNKDADIGKELQKRFQDVVQTWQKLGPFFKHSNCTNKFKLQVYQSVVASKLLYGLETAQLNCSTQRKLDTFQLRGIRQILHITTTFVNRTHTNPYVYEQASQVMGRTLLPLSQQYNLRKATKFLTLLKDNAVKQEQLITVNLTTLRPPTTGPLRVGNPRDNWVLKTTAWYWDWLRKFKPVWLLHNNNDRTLSFQWSLDSHRSTIILAARNLVYPAYPKDISPSDFIDYHV